MRFLPDISDTGMGNCNDSAALEKWEDACAESMDTRPESY